MAVKTAASLEELAVPFEHELCAHIKEVDTQSTSTGAASSMPAGASKQGDFWRFGADLRHRARQSGMEATAMNESGKLAPDLIPDLVRPSGREPHVRRLVGRSW
jgi:hypothetical protein